MIVQIVKKWQPFFEIQDAGDSHLKIFHNMHFRRHRYVPNRSPNVSTNFGYDGSNTKEMAVVF